MFDMLMQNLLPAGVTMNDVTEQAKDFVNRFVKLEQDVKLILRNQSEIRTLLQERNPGNVNSDNNGNGPE